MKFNPLSKTNMKRKSDRLNVLRHQNTEKVEITLQRVAQYPKNNGRIEPKLTAEQEDYLLEEAQEKYYEEKL